MRVKSSPPSSPRCCLPRRHLRWEWTCPPGPWCSTASGNTTGPVLEICCQVWCSPSLSSKATIDYALSSPEDELQNTCILMSLSCFELYFQVSTFRWRAEPAGGAWTPQAPSSFCVRPEFTRWQICTSWCWWGFKISFRGVLKSHSMCFFFSWSPVYLACVTKKVCWVILSSFNCTAEWVILAHFPSAGVWRPVVLFQCCLQ